jgi:elongation factor G
MDRVGANFLGAVEMMRTRLGANAAPVQLPIGEGELFNGIIDLLEMKAYVYDDSTLGARFEIMDIPGDLLEAAKAARADLIERLAESDEQIMEVFAHNGEPGRDEFVAAIRRATCNALFVPVLCGSAFKNKGVQRLLDAIIDYLPSPADLPAVEGIHPKTGEVIHREASDDAPLAALAFKISTDTYVGKLAYLRIYSGTLKAGSYVHNIRPGTKQRIGRILQMHANKREELDEARAGDIVAAVGFKDLTTGDTVAANEHPILLEQMKFPEPVIAVAVEPKTKADQDRLAETLHKLSEEDPTFRVATDEDTGQTIISGMGELHLEIIVDRMLREFKVEANVGRPEVAYKETISAPARSDTRFVRQTGGHGQFAHVVIEVEPTDPGGGLLFENKIVGGIIPREFIPAVEKGVREGMESGVLAGYPLIDILVRLVDGSYHEVDSSEIAFKIAGSMAIKDATKKGKPVLLEPLMNVEVVVPPEYTGDVTGDLSSRRGKIAGMVPRGDVQVVAASVPLAEMFGYATRLRSITQGRAVYSMEFAHFEKAPQSVVQRITQAVA